jgi:hypothetical protein
MMQIFPQVVAGASQNGKVDWKQVGLGLGMVGLGYFAKDKNVTGGDIKQ